MARTDTDNDKDYKEIQLYDFWKILKRCFVFMIIAAILVAGGTYVASMVTFTPMYESTATLYILKTQNDNQQSSNDSSNFSLALNVVDDCTFLIKSHKVLDRVIDELGLKCTYSTLYNKVTTNNPENTRILQITVKTTNAKKSQTIVNKICDIGIESIKEAMGMEQVNKHEGGVLNTKICNQISKRTFVLYGAIAAVLVYVVFFLIFVLDDSLITNEDLENVLGIGIISEIPNAYEHSSGEYNGKQYKKGYGGYGYGYGRQYKYGYGYYKKSSSSKQDAEPIENSDSDKKEVDEQ